MVSLRSSQDQAASLALLGQRVVVVGGRRRLGAVTASTNRITAGTSTTAGGLRAVGERQLRRGRREWLEARVGRCRLFGMTAGLECNEFASGDVLAKLSLIDGVAMGVILVVGLNLKVFQWNSVWAAVSTPRSYITIGAA